MNVPNDAKWCGVIKHDAEMCRIVLDGSGRSGASVPDVNVTGLRMMQDSVE